MNILAEMSLTPEELREFLEEFEESRRSRRRAWTVLQRFRAILTEKGGAVIPSAQEKSFTAEGTLLERALEQCIGDRDAALKELARAARRVDKAAFGNEKDFGPAHQALLKALDRAGAFVDP